MNLSFTCSARSSIIIKCRIPHFHHCFSAFFISRFQLISVCLVHPFLEFFSRNLLPLPVHCPEVADLADYFQNHFKITLLCSGMPACAPCGVLEVSSWLFTNSTTVNQVEQNVVAELARWNAHFSLLQAVSAVLCKTPPTDQLLQSLTLLKQSVVCSLLQTPSL